MQREGNDVKYGAFQSPFAHPGDDNMLQQDVIVAESKTQDEVLRERQAHAERTGRVIEVDNSDDDFHELPSKLLAADHR
jgi:hypothetical protein